MIIPSSGTLRGARMGTKMDRIAAGIAIALCALVMTGGLMRDVMAADTAEADRPSGLSPAPVLNGPRSELVLSLILALEALRTAPAILDRPKV
jgi:hypothetical protein